MIPFFRQNDARQEAANSLPQNILLGAVRVTSGTPLVVTAPKRLLKCSVSFNLPAADEVTPLILKAASDAVSRL